MPDNPFDDIRRKHEEEAQKRQLAYQKELEDKDKKLRAQSEEQAKRMQRIEEIHQKYHPIVVEVLTQLRDVLYPDYKIENSGGSLTWEIQKRFSQPSTLINVSEMTTYSVLIIIEIMLDENLKPQHFSCYHHIERGQKWSFSEWKWKDIYIRIGEKTAGLSKEELLQAVRLYTS